MTNNILTLRKVPANPTLSLVKRPIPAPSDDAPLESLGTPTPTLQERMNEFLDRMGVKRA